MRNSAATSALTRDSAQPQMPPSKTVPEVAQILGCSERYVWYIVRNGELRSFKHAGKRLVLDEALAEYIRQTTGDVA